MTTLADRPDLATPVLTLADAWPTFMTKDPIAALYYNPDVVRLFSDHVLAGVDDTGALIAKALSIPLYLAAGEPLPDDGWDGAIRRGIQTRLLGLTPNASCALEIAIRPGARGSGLSSTMLLALRDNAQRLGFHELLVPLPPNGKSDIHEPMSSYAFRTRPDDLPVDPWLRVHVRAGGRIDGIAPRSMVIPGTLDEWREWTGLPFDTSGPVDVPGALAPVMCDVDSRIAVYVEPDVWVRHRTSEAPIS